VNEMKKNIIHSLSELFTLFIFYFFITIPLTAQEPLPDILQRGYISQWLVCGPFPSDLSKGIRNAIRNNESPLGTRDFWTSKGGITQLLPQVGEKVDIDGITYTWLPFTVKSPGINFYTLQPPEECIFYLSAYVQVPDDQVVYINLQTPLGARLWISKTLIRDVKAMPVEHLGIDRALVRLRKGLNLFVIQVPFLSIQSINDITGIPINEIPTKLWSQKEPNIGQTGYELTFHIHPIEPAGSIFYVPLLESSRKFTGSGVDPKQVFYLTIYNPTSKQIFPVDINAWVMPLNFSLPSQQISLQPQEEIRLPIQIPNKTRKENEKINVRMLITAPNEQGEKKTSEFLAQINLLETEPLSKTYLLTGTWGKPRNGNDISEYFHWKKEACKTQIWTAYEYPEYGTDIGSGNLWLSMLSENPEMLVHSRETLARGKSTAQNIFSPIDERLVSIETILMNILIGTKLKEGIWKEFNKSFIAWDYPYLTPQTSHIINKSHFKGILFNLSNYLTPPLAFLREPTGNSVMVRTLETPPSFRNFQEIKKWAYISHKEIESLIPEIDVLLLENTSSHLNTNILPELKNEVPPFYFYSIGSSEFFEEIQDFLYSRNETDRIPHIFQPLYSKEELPDLLSNSFLKTCLYQFEENLTLSQITSTIASIFGMSYPDELITRLWTLLLQIAEPNIINAHLTDNEITSLLFQFSTGIHDTEKIIQQTMKYIAETTNTLTHIADNKQNSHAVVVLNPNSTVKSLPVIANVPIPNTNYSLMTFDGKPVPFHLHTVRQETSSIVTYQIEFIAEEIPPLGIKTFYLVPENKPSLPVKASDNFIENDFLLLRINTKTGNISQIIDKTTGKDIIPPENNFDIVGFAKPDKRNFKPFSETLTKYETYKSDLLQRITIQFENQNGTLTKEYCVYQKVPRIFCFHNYSPPPKLPEETITSAFPTLDDNTVAIYGSQSFAFSAPPLNSDGGDGSSLFFAHRFFAKSPGDYIKNEENLAIPLTNVNFIKSEEANIPVLQTLIKKTLWSRGIPSNEISFQDWIQKNHMSSSLYIWTGTTTSYENLKKFINDISPTINNEVIKRSEFGTPFVIDVQENNSNYTILGFIANTTEKLGSVINNFLNMLNQRNEFFIPSAVSKIQGKEIPSQGYALLFKGTKLVYNNPNHSFYLYHGNIDIRNPSPRVNAIPIHYQIVPFSGHWLKANLIEQGSEKPLLSAITGFHGGPWQNNTRFLSVSNPNIIISGIKSMGTGIPFIQTDRNSPIDMFIVRLNCLTQQKQECSLTSAFTISKIQSLTPLENSETSLTNLKEESIEFNPWDIRTFAVSLKKVSVPNKTPFDMKDIYYSYDNNNVFPLQYTIKTPILKMTPIKTSLTNNIELTICNLDTNKTIQGIVYFETPKNYILKTSQVPYDLPPLTVVQHTIPYEQTEIGNSNLFANAWTEVDGKIVRTFLIGDEFPAKIRYEKDISQIKIIIENTLDIPLYGNIAWTSIQYSPTNHNLHFNKFIKPEFTELYIKPHETNVYTFLPGDTALTASPIARIQINNKINFLPIQ